MTVNILTDNQRENKYSLHFLYWRNGPFSDSCTVMRISDPILNMDMANYSEVLDPSYANLEFETIQVLYNGNGEFELLYL